MVFSSFVFLYGFLPMLLLLYFSFPGFNAKNTILLVFSLLFYTWGEPIGVVILLLGVLVGWVGGSLMSRIPRAAKAVLIVSVGFQVLLLITFKYVGFLLESFKAVTSIDIPDYDPSLPIGISFFTFHLISYLVDVYRKEAKPISSYSKLLLYISLFPQLVAGPIVRYADIQTQLNKRRITIEGFSSGVVRFVIGLGKKVIFANALSELTPVLLDGNLRDLSVLGAWFGIMLFALQIYFDFSGYSDMAIGLGRMFGFTFKENFDYPYISRSATEFWRRWNISVGRFFRDYVYIPLGGNRRRALFNLFAVWFLTGLWHGASWNFVIWGLYFGILITLEKSFLHRVLASIPAAFSYLYFMTAVLVGWVFFYFESLPRAFAFLRTMFGLESVPFTSGEMLIHLENHLLLLVFAVIAATPLPVRIHRLLSERMKPRFARLVYVNAILPAACLSVLGGSALLLVGKTYAPFFYFRF